MSDPYLSSVSLLLHFEGSDTSTTFTDSSTIANTITVVGNAQIDTAQSKYGSASGLFDGTGDYLYFDGGTPLAFSTGDFTIETFVRFNSLSAYSVIYDGRELNTSGNYIIITLDSTGDHIKANVDAGTVITCTTTLSTGTWYHVALVRSGDVFTLYIDGIDEDTVTVGPGFSLINGPDRPTIGGSGYAPGTLCLDGWLDEMRVTKGVARYTSAFTPPSSAFSDATEIYPPFFIKSPVFYSSYITDGTIHPPFFTNSNIFLPGIPLHEIFEQFVAFNTVSDINSYSVQQASFKTNSDIVSYNVQQVAFKTNSDIDAYIDAQVRFRTTSDMDVWEEQQTTFVTSSDINSYKEQKVRFKTVSDLVAYDVQQINFKTSSDIKVYGYVVQQGVFGTSSDIVPLVEQKVSFKTNSDLNVYAPTQVKFKSTSDINVYKTAQVIFKTSSDIVVYAEQQTAFVSSSDINVYAEQQASFLTSSDINVYTTSKVGFITSSDMVVLETQQGIFTTSSDINASVKYYGYALNLSTGAVSKLDNFKFNSLYGDRGADENGIYTLTGNVLTNDKAFIETGIMSFNSDKLKRVTDAYLNQDGGPLKLTLTTDNGIVGYTFRATTKLTNVKQDLARGAKGKYWQAKIENVNGSQASVDGVEFIVDELSRRI